MTMCPSDCKQRGQWQVTDPRSSLKVAYPQGRVIWTDVAIFQSLIPLCNSTDNPSILPFLSLQCHVKKALSRSSRLPPCANKGRLFQTVLVQQKCQNLSVTFRWKKNKYLFEVVSGKILRNNHHIYDFIIFGQPYFQLKRILHINCTTVILQA